MADSEGLNEIAGIAIVNPYRVSNNFPIFIIMLGLLVEIVINALLFLGKPRARLSTVVVITTVILVAVVVTIVKKSSI